MTDMLKRVADAIESQMARDDNSPEDLARAAINASGLLAVRDAAMALLADVRRRYPGEALRCPLMVALDEATPPAP